MPAENKLTDTENHNPNPTPRQPRYRLRRSAFILLGLIIFAASIALVFFWIANRPVKTPHPTTVNLAVVEVVPVTLADHAVSVEANGFVEAKYTTTLSPQVSGKIIDTSSKLFAGKRVDKDEWLIRIDPTDYQANVANAKAALANAQSQYHQEQGRARQAQRDVKRLGIKATPLSLRKPQLAAAQANIDNAKAQLQLAQSNLARTEIKAPFNAIINSQQASIGNVVSAASRLATLVGTDVFTVKLNLSAQDFQLIRIGDAVVINDINSDISYHTTINRIDAGLDLQNRTISVYADIEKPLSKTRLLLNSYVNASISGKHYANSQWLVNTAIINNQAVWHKKTDDTIVLVPIHVIHRGKTQSLVTYERIIDNVILRPKEGFYNGQTVTTEQPENHVVSEDSPHG